MRAAAVQLNSTAGRARNLAAAGRLVRAAAAEAPPAHANRRPEAYRWPQPMDSEPERSERAYPIRRERSAGEVSVRGA
jgi:hypothetical protein